MRKNDILKLTGLELTRQLKASLDEGRITLKEYNAIIKFWQENHLSTGEDIAKTQP